MSSEFSQFQDAFFEEAAEHLAIVEEGLLALEQHPEDLDLLNKIFRSAHSIKGTSGMFGFNAVAQFTHKMETLLDLLRNGQKVVTPVIADLLLRATDCLKTLIDAAKTGSQVDEATVQHLTEELAASQSASMSQPKPQGSEPSRAHVGVDGVRPSSLCHCMDSTGLVIPAGTRSAPNLQRAGQSWDRIGRHRRYDKIA